MQRDIKFEIMLLKHNRDFSKSIIKQYTSLEHLMSGRDVSLYANLQVVAKRQFTGLKDKNGTEIYEGDIVKFHPYHNLAHKQDKHINAVFWGETGDSDGWAHGKHYEWCVGYDSLADVADSDHKETMYCEVIGNIYENPELLGETK